MSHKLPTIEDTIKGLVWNGDEKQALVELLERGGFLSSPSTGYYDDEVRRGIILRLAEVGDESALPVLRGYVSHNGNTPDPICEAMAKAAQSAIEAIEKRTGSSVKLRDTQKPSGSPPEGFHVLRSTLGPPVNCREAHERWLPGESRSCTIAQASNP